MLMHHSEPQANANDLPREVQMQQLAGDAQQEEGRNSAPPAPPTGSTPFAPPAENVNVQGNTTVPANALLIAIDGSVVYDIIYDGTVYSKTGTATVKKLIESSPAAVDERCGKDGQFALMHAATLGHTAIVQALLEASANVNLLCYEGRSALMWAARNGHYSVVLALLQASPSANVDLRSTCQAGFTALMWAAWYGHTTIVRLLLGEVRECVLNASANVDLQSKLGYTALMVAAWNGHTAVVKLLLATASVDLQSHTRKTALMAAGENGRTAIVRLLLAAGAVTTLRDTNGAYAETFARRRNQAAAVLLLQGESLRTRRAFGQRALAAAARIRTKRRHVDQRILDDPAANHLEPDLPFRV